jgi:transcriptional regulator of arginine metabolism
MSKAYRQRQILNLLRTSKIHTQEDLARELKNAGIEATQVTLSRDLRELGLVKTAEGYRNISSGPPRPHFQTIVAEFLQDIRAAQNLLVLRTSPGNANTLAAAVDAEDWPEVVGTLAGDDTVLVIAPDAQTAAAVRTRLLALLTE